jgi:hypothetical protein
MRRPRCRGGVSSALTDPPSPSRILGAGLRRSASSRREVRAIARNCANLKAVSMPLSVSPNAKGCPGPQLALEYSDLDTRVRHQVAVTKDEFECVYLAGFSRAVSAFPAEPVSKSENPDFLVRSADHTTGIELTRLFKAPARGQSPLRAPEGLRELIATLAKSRYGAMKRSPNHVSIHFNDQPALRKAEVSPLVALLRLGYRPRGCLVRVGRPGTRSVEEDELQ